MDIYMGTILVWPGQYNPMYTGYCNGATLSINQYQALFSILGYTYGGSSTTFQLPDLRGRVPLGAGYYSDSFITHTYALNEHVGSSGTVLGIANLPAHSHTATFTPTVATATSQLSVAGSGSITGTASFDVTPGTTGATDPAASEDYYLTGVTGVGAGPCTKTAPGANKATLIGGNVDLDTSGYVPSISNASFSFDTVVGGTVAVGQTGTGAVIDNRQPSLVLDFIMVMNGIYPARAN